MSNVIPIRGGRRGFAANQLFVDRYRLLDQLGRGGMGEVWAAWDERIGRVVAIKLLHPSLLLVPGYRERFDREARALTQLEHPNVVPLYDAGTEPQPFFVMKRILGITLREMLREHGRIGWIEVVCFAIPIADGLAAAHRMKLWHRDVKPENLMVDEDDNVYILDLGIARDAGARSGEATDRIGTLGYLPPEMIQRQPTDHRGDLYQLGVVLYELLTGRKPYSGINESSETEMQAAHVHFAPDTIEVDCPDALRAIVLRLLAKDPAQRFQSARALAAELGQVLRKHGSLPAGDALEPLVHRAMVRRKLRRLTIAEQPEREQQGPPNKDSLPMEHDQTQPMRSTLELGSRFVPVSPASPAAQLAVKRAPAPTQRPTLEPERATVSILPGYVPSAPMPFRPARPKRRADFAGVVALAVLLFVAAMVLAAHVVGQRADARAPETSPPSPSSAAPPASAAPSARLPASAPISVPSSATVAASASATAPTKSAAPAAAAASVPARSAAPARAPKRQPPLPFDGRPIF